MSSGEDSETAEWEREQMLRGTQSRRQQRGQQQSRAEKTIDTINATVAKNYVNQDIVKAEASIELTKRSIGSTRLDIVRSEKKIEALKKQIDKLESSESFFRELAVTTESSDALNLLSKHRSIITRLPRDQKEMIDLLDKKLKGAQLPMDVDNQ